MAKLTVVPTPVGNLEDMTFRAIRVLKEADLILAEDTRTTGILLKHFEIQNKMQSHHKFNEHKTVEQIAARIKGGENIALVSDAGTQRLRHLITVYTASHFAIQLVIFLCETGLLVSISTRIFTSQYFGL